MNPRIETSSVKKLVGKRRTMSFARYKVAGLWKSFMQRRKDVTNNLTDDLISMAVYQPAFFANFYPATTFEKWAAIEVENFDIVPEDMETFTLEGGLYAVFDYKGLNTDNAVYQYIFGTWLPGSAYLMDDRPHFEILGDKYKNNDPMSEEEIWIPVKLK